MTPFEELSTQLEALWGGKTLATLREEAARELNGTCFQALRTAPGPRRFLIFCITGEHQLQRLTSFDQTSAHLFGDWSSTSLIEVVARTIASGGFSYDFDQNYPGKLKPMVLIAVTPKSVGMLERLFGLQP
jgi:hypothetical protein